MPARLKRLLLQSVPFIVAAGLGAFLLPHPAVIDMRPSTLHDLVVLLLACIAYDRIGALIDAIADRRNPVPADPTD
ncbi:hypothetical protein [Streptacidiphilus melanogenes]|uniref:hypothetical protein n=1 Tax=Streptacidiphilus melanogenes TaxID=411235 RepID=UPI0005A8B5CB|nr:hypothetical protein [Streptacidiphilus melanogenes]